MMDEAPRITIPTLKVLTALTASPRPELAGADIGRETGIGPGTLYPLLARLESAGWLTSNEEVADPRQLGRPRRRFYRLTEAGSAGAQAAAAELPGTAPVPMTRFALIAAHTSAEILDPEGVAMAPGLRVFTHAPVALEQHWREWLGSIQAEAVGRSNLYILAEAPADQPSGSMDVNDASWYGYLSMILAGRLVGWAPPLKMWGVRVNDTYGVRHVQHMQQLGVMLGVWPDKVTADMVALAGQIYSALRDLFAYPPGKFVRLRQIIRIYVKTRCEGEMMDLLHQYCRCIEGLISSDPGKGRAQFAGRTALFLGAGHESPMTAIYGRRSSVEHIKEDLYDELRTREARIEMVEQTVIAEAIIRRCLCRILLTPALWPHFEDDAALKAFWNLTHDERQSAWGPVINPLDALKDFEPKRISDRELGL